ncbi:universal stress protein [Halalkalirubrum salinum]|uniref:universal stress protein n=1 Tax=Halalkalirubrum salinum TaxID=2563889 RepID=UPI0010FB6A11|nr:universal stress protein [Halalkalirubrum salinum]
MTESLNRVLIPIDVSKPLSLGGTLIETLPLANTVLLGYWQIPDQTQSDQARDQFEAEAQQRLQTVAKRFTDQGVDLQTRLVFTNDRNQSIDTATNEYECQSVLIPGTESPPSGTTRGLVLIKPNTDLDRIIATLGALFEKSDVELQLFHVVGSKNEHLYDATEYMLRGLADRLSELGISRDRVKWKQSMEGKRIEVILSQVPDFDFVVMGESTPTVRARIFGDVQSRLANETEKPLLTIRTSN